MRFDPPMPRKRSSVAPPISVSSAKPPRTALKFEKVSMPVAPEKTSKSPSLARPVPRFTETPCVAVS